MQKITVTKKSIQKDKLYILNEEKINKDLNNSNTINILFEKEYLFQEESTKIFNSLQKEIKKLISEHEVQEDDIKWGESYKIDTLVEFPISVRISGSIKKIGEFFKSIKDNKKIYIKSFIIRKTKKFYFLEISLYGLKRD